MKRKEIRNAVNQAIDNIIYEGCTDVAIFGNPFEIKLLNNKETRKKIGYAHKGKPCHRRLTDKWRNSVIEAKSIPINQFSKDGMFIKQWSSMTEAARYYNLPKSCISRVCKDERKSCGGFIWKYCQTK